MKTLEVQKESKNYGLTDFREAENKINGCLSSQYADLYFQEVYSDCFGVQITYHGGITDKMALREIAILVNYVSGKSKTEKVTNGYLQKFQNAVKIQMKHGEEPATGQENTK